MAKGKAKEFEINSNLEDLTIIEFLDNCPRRANELYNYFKNRDDVKLRSKSSIISSLKKLTRRGIISRFPNKWSRNDKFVLYYLPKKPDIDIANRLISDYLNKIKKPGEYIKNESEVLPDSKIEHTKDIHNLVIKPLLKNFPLVCTDGIFWKYGDVPLTILKPYIYKFPDACQVLRIDIHLYEDLKENHILNEPDNPSDLLDEFSNKSIIFWEKKRKLMNQIDKWVIDYFKLYRNATFRYLRQVIYQHFTFAAYCETTTIKPGHPIWPYSNFDDFNLRYVIKHDINQVEYYNYIDRPSEEIELQERMNRKIKRPKLYELEFKKIKGKYHTKLYDNQKDWVKKEYIIQMVDIYKIGMELNKLKKRIKETLKKYLYHHILAGDCKYLNKEK